MVVPTVKLFMAMLNVIVWPDTNIKKANAWILTNVIKDRVFYFNTGLLSILVPLNGRAMAPFYN